MPMGVRRGGKNARIHFEKASSELQCRAGWCFSLHPDLFIASRGILISPASASSAAVIHSQALINLINFGANTFSLSTAVIPLACAARVAYFPFFVFLCAAGCWELRERKRRRLSVPVCGALGVLQIYKWEMRRAIWRKRREFFPF